MNESTTPPPAAKLRRIDLAHAIYKKLRCEKNPPLARYTVLIGMARTGKPVTAAQAAALIGENTTISGTMDGIERSGLGRQTNAAPNGARRWVLTPKGEALVQELINPPIPD